MANLQRTALSTVLLVFLACFACLYTGGRRGTLPRAVQGCRSLMAGPRGGLPHCAVCAARPCLAGVQHLRGLLRAGARALGHGGMNARSVPARGTALAGHRFLWHWPRPAARRACRGCCPRCLGWPGSGRAHAGDAGSPRRALAAAPPTAWLSTLAVCCAGGCPHAAR